MFEFDPGKRAVNLVKHGIDFEAAQALWTDELRLVVDTRRGDPDHLGPPLAGRGGKAI